MSNFLFGDSLSKAIRTICKGKDIKIASAFWGKGAVENLNFQLESTKIICDISMGGTNPKELRALGAPLNSKLRALGALHAKVYLSSNGGVICSANASSNGVGFFLQESKLIEAGVFCGPESAEWKAASVWFDSLYDRENCLIVNGEALAMAEKTWKRRVKGSGVSNAVQAFDIDDALDSNPALLDGWGFVFSQEGVSQEIRDNIKNENDIEGAGYDFFTDWGDEIKNFPPSFLNIHRVKSKIYLHANDTLGVGRPVKGIDSVVITQKRNFSSVFPRSSKQMTEEGRLENFKMVLDSLVSEDGREGKVFSDAAALREYLNRIKKPAKRSK